MVKEIFKPIYQKIFPSLVLYLKRELSNCNTVLDLGCGNNSLLQYCNASFSLGVENFEPYLKENKKKRIHNQYIKADITKIDFKPKSFDAVIAIDVLEHLTKKEGYKLLEKMEKWAKKKIIIFTPNGFVFQDGYDNNPLQEHKSGWEVKELEELGFEVFGMNGWKELRGYKASIKYRPIILWRIISDLTQKMVYYYPKLAFQLYAVKKININNSKPEQKIYGT